MIVAIHQPQYFPWVPYCDKADACDCFVYLDTVQYQKNGVQNRNQIKTAQGAAWLTVPVRASGSLAIREIPLADATFAKRHLRSIDQNYARAAFVEQFRQGLRPILEREWTQLAELNIAVTEWMFAALGIETRRVRASQLNVAGSGEELVINICKALGAASYLSGHGAKAYQLDANFEAQGIELRYHEYRSQSYAQCFPTLGFIPDLSALDLILNHGPAARGIMLAGRGKTRVPVTGS